MTKNLNSSDGLEGSQESDQEGSIAEPFRNENNITAVWTQDFESGPGDWSIEGGVWQIGKLAKKKNLYPHNGSSVSGTVLDGPVPADTQDAWLVSPEFRVGEIENNPRLRYWQWHDLVHDRGEFYIREAGENWHTPEGMPFVTNYRSSWTQRLIDLRRLAGKRIQVGFRFHRRHSSNTRGLGWFIDDVRYEEGEIPWIQNEGFESGFGDWSVESGIWEINEPARGLDQRAKGGPEPKFGKAYACTRCSGVMPTHTFDATLISPPLVVPAEDTHPKLRYWQWYNLIHDEGYLQIRTDGGKWRTVKNGLVKGSSGGWSQRMVDLRPYAGDMVQLGFRIHRRHSSNSVGLGWYIDNISIEADSTSG